MSGQLITEAGKYMYAQMQKRATLDEMRPGLVALLEPVRPKVEEAGLTMDLFVHRVIECFFMAVLESVRDEALGRLPLAVKRFPADVDVRRN